MLHHHRLNCWTLSLQLQRSQSWTMEHHQPNYLRRKGSFDHLLLPNMPQFDETCRTKDILHAAMVLTPRSQHNQSTSKEAVLSRSRHRPCRPDRKRELNHPCRRLQREPRRQPRRPGSNCDQTWTDRLNHSSSWTSQHPNVFERSQMH